MWCQCVEGGSWSWRMENGNVTEGRVDLNEGEKGEMQMAGWALGGTTSWVAGKNCTEECQVPGGQSGGQGASRAAGAKSRSGRCGQGPLAGSTANTPPGSRAQTTNETVPPPQRIASHRSSTAQTVNLFSGIPPFQRWDGDVLNFEIESTTLFLCDSLVHLLVSAPPPPPRREETPSLARSMVRDSAVCFAVRCSVPLNHCPFSGVARSPLFGQNRVGDAKTRSASPPFGPGRVWPANIFTLAPRPPHHHTSSIRLIHIASLSLIAVHPPNWHLPVCLEKEGIVHLPEAARRKRFAMC